MRQQLLGSVRVASSTVEVPGCPRSLRPEGLVTGSSADEYELTWSYTDPSAAAGPDRSQWPRLVGTSRVRVGEGDPRESAWDALLTHVGRWGAVVTETEDEGNAESWTVPAATPLSDGVPLWVADEIAEEHGAGDVLALDGNRIYAVRD